MGQIVETQVSRNPRLIVSHEARHAADDIAPLGEAGAPPGVVLGDAVKLGQIEGDRLDHRLRRRRDRGVEALIGTRRAEAGTNLGDARRPRLGGGRLDDNPVAALRLPVKDEMHEGVEPGACDVGVGEQIGRGLEMRRGIAVLRGPIGQIMLDRIKAGAGDVRICRQIPGRVELTGFGNHTRPTPQLQRLGRTGREDPSSDPGEAPQDLAQTPLPAADPAQGCRHAPGRGFMHRGERLAVGERLALGYELLALSYELLFASGALGKCRYQLLFASGVLGKCRHQLIFAALQGLEGGIQVSQLGFQLLRVAHAGAKRRVPLGDLLLEQSGYAAQRPREFLAGAGQRGQRGIPFGERRHELLRAVHLRCENGIALRERRSQFCSRLNRSTRSESCAANAGASSCACRVCAAVELRCAIFCWSRAMARVFSIKLALLAARMGWKTLSDSRRTSWSRSSSPSSPTRPDAAFSGPAERLLEPGCDIRALFKLLGGGDMVAHVRATENPPLRARYPAAGRAM